MKWQAALLFTGLFLLVASFCVVVETPFLDKPLLTHTAEPQNAGSAAISVSEESVELPSEETLGSKNLIELLPEDEIRWLQIQTLESRRTVTFELETDGWFLRFPVRAPANNVKVKEIVSLLLSLEKISEMSPEKNWDEYGLERPRFKIGLETLKSSRRYLYLGAVSPVGNVLFARWEDENRYFLLPREIESFFMQSVYDFRDKRVFSMKPGAVRRIKLETPEAHFEIENQGAQWVWKEPKRMQWAPCPAGDAEALLEHLRGLFVKDFLKNVSEEEAGLGQGMKITLWADPTHFEVLELGNEAIVRDAYYAQTSGNSEMLLVARTKLNLFIELFRALADDQAILVGPLAAPHQED